jgi:hypothetical protein
MFSIKDSLRKYKQELDTLVKLKESQNMLIGLFNHKNKSPEQKREKQIDMSRYLVKKEDAHYNSSS